MPSAPRSSRHPKHDERRLGLPASPFGRNGSQAHPARSLTLATSPDTIGRLGDHTLTGRSAKITSMSFQTPITIKRVLERIQAREYVLPAIQREFVWGRQDIALLFDSLLRKYPIGSFLFWRVQPEHSLDFRFYEFMTKYHERDFRHNPILQLAAPRELTAILDGQQRLSALAIGLTGSHTEKLPRKWANNPDSFPTTYLFCELCHEARLDEPNMMYRFEFLTEGRAADENENFKGQRLWYPVKEILGMENLSAASGLPPSEPSRG